MAKIPSIIENENAVEAFVPAYVSNTSAVKTPGSSGVWHSMTDNEITLTPGDWRLLPSLMNFSSSGGSAQFSPLTFGWFSANGTDTTTKPTALDAAPNLTVLSSTESDVAGHRSETLASPVDFKRLYSGEVIVRVTVDTTVYLVSQASMVTPSVARLQAYPNAQRIEKG